MTAVCPGGGASGPKPGVDSAIAFGGTAIDAAVSAAGYPELGPVIGVIAAGAAFTTDVFCTTDPPADPGVTLTDITNVINPQEPLNFAPAAAKIRDWFLHWYWWDVCACTGGNTPAPPAVVLPPGYGTNPSLPNGSVTGACWDVTVHAELATAGPGPAAGAGSWQDIATRLLPNGAQTTFGGGGPNQTDVTVIAIPSGVSALRLTLTSAAPVGTNGAGSSVYFLNASLGILTGLHAVLPAGQTSITSTLATLPTGAVWWGSDVQNQAQAAGSFSVELSFDCANGPPGQLSVPCCPPDPLVQRYLQMIFNLEEQILQLLGQAGPGRGPYIDSVRHQALSGGGTIAIAPSSRAVRLEVTTPLASWPQNPQVPTYFFSLGFITPFAVGTPLRGQRLIYNHQIFSWPTYTDTIGYTLTPGIVADLVELL